QDAIGGQVAAESIFGAAVGTSAIGEIDDFNRARMLSASGKRGGYAEASHPGLERAHTEFGRIRRGVCAVQMTAAGRVPVNAGAILKAADAAGARAVEKVILKRRVRILHIELIRFDALCGGVEKILVRIRTTGD